MQLAGVVRFERVDKFWFSGGLVSNAEAFGQMGVILSESSFLGRMVGGGAIKMGIKVDYAFGALRRYGGMGYEFYVAYIFEEN